MKQLKRNKGITLISLIVTIILIIILASVVMYNLLGGNGLFLISKEARFKAKMSSIAEEVNIYNLNLSLNEEKVENLYAGKLAEQIIKQNEIDIGENPVISLKTISKNVGNAESKYSMVYEGVFYYVSQKNIKDNEKQVQWCKEIGIPIWEYSNSNSGIKVTNGKYEEVNGVYLCTPNLSTGFKKENTRYMYTRNSNFVPGNWINQKPEEDWYDYKNSIWANIYVETNGIGSYYTWIPRYCYKVLSTEAGNQRMDVKFVDCNNNYINAETGENLTEKQLLEEQGYKIPEAFWWDNNNDGTETINERLPGYWISKYQLSELEAGKYIIDYNTAVNMRSVTIKDIKENIPEGQTVAKYTFSINGNIIPDHNTKDDLTVIASPGKKTINVTALNSNGEIIGSMTKIFEVANNSAPDTSSFDQDTTFCVWYDEQGNEHNETPIRNKDSIKDKWYDYTTGNWANIVTRNNGEETYFTWIPRYMYTLDDVSRPQKSEVKFIGTDISNYAGNVPSPYKVPDAFWWDNNNNGKEDEGEQLSGYWISKYQLQDVSNYTRIDTNIKAGSDKIRVKEFTGSLIDNINTNNTPITVEYYLNGEKMKDAKGDSLNENYIYKNLNVGTTYTINIIVRNKETNEYIGAVTKKLTTIAPEPPLFEVEGQGFNKSETYYVWYDDDGTEHNDKPISEAPPENWYDYSDGKWANIVTKAEGTLTYFTWIPRYEYKLDASVNPQKSNVNFVGTDVRNENGKCSPGYQVPDAFWWDNNNNGKEDEGEQLTGYWITKYQLK